MYIGQKNYRLAISK